MLSTRKSCLFPSSTINEYKKNNTINLNLISCDYYIMAEAPDALYFSLNKNKYLISNNSKIHQLDLDLFKI